MDPSKEFFQISFTVESDLLINVFHVIIEELRNIGARLSGGWREAMAENFERIYEELRDKSLSGVSIKGIAGTSYIRGVKPDYLKRKKKKGLEDWLMVLTKSSKIALTEGVEGKGVGDRGSMGAVSTMTRDGDLFVGLDKTRFYYMRFQVKGGRDIFIILDRTAGKIADVASEVFNEIINTAVRIRGPGFVGYKRGVL